MATATTTTFTFTNFNRVPKPWAGGPILLPDKVSVHVGYAADGTPITAPASAAAAASAPPKSAPAPAAAAPKTKSVATPKPVAAPAPAPAAAPVAEPAIAAAAPVAAANIAPKPFSALDAANSASGLYSAQNVAAAAASQGAVKTDLSTLRQTVVPLNTSGGADISDPETISHSPTQQISSVPSWSNRNQMDRYATPTPNYCYTHYGTHITPKNYTDEIGAAPVRIETLPSSGAFRKNPAHQVHVPDKLRLRGGVIEEDDGGVVTESLHKPSQEKRNSCFGGNTTQSRSFKVLEETMAAEGDLAPPPTTIDFQTGEIILKSKADAIDKEPAQTVQSGPNVSHAFSVKSEEANDEDPADLVTPVANDVSLSEPEVPKSYEIPHIPLGAPIVFTVAPSAPSGPIAPIAPSAPTVPVAPTEEGAPIVPSAPIGSTSNVTVTRRPKNTESKESRQVKRLSSSGEDDTHCFQSKSFKALEHMLFQEGNSAESDASEALAPAPAEVVVLD